VTGSADASVTFSSIPATYRDLILVFNGQTTPATAYIEVALNGDETGSNYSHVVAQGNGSAPLSFSATGNSAAFVSDTPTVFALQFMDYSATDKHKTMVWRSSSGQQIVQMGAWRWANTAAVNSIKLYDTSGESFAVGSTFSLYGIEA
jgi:hypothetical protein